MLKRIPILLYILLGITLVIALLYYFGGEIDPTDERPEPVYTDILLYWIYAILSFCIIVTAIFTIRKFLIRLKSSPRKAIRFIFMPVILAIVMTIAWSLGDGTPLQILRYEGKENIYFWLKVTDMFLYTIYFLLGMGILSVIYYNVKKALQK